MNTPELDRMIEVRDKSELCGEFLEWLQSKYAMFDKKIPRESFGYHGTNGDYINTEKVLAEFFTIDLGEVERERQMLLKTL